MVTYEFERSLVGYCGLYCRFCDYYTNALAKASKNLLNLVEAHGELKPIAEPLT